MKITTNSIGNYVPQIKKSTEQPAAVKSYIDKDENKKQDESKITSDEKMFFMKLYPQNESEIMNFHFYEKSGRMSGVKLGTLLDKRG